jgi:hypothetical protein
MAGSIVGWLTGSINNEPNRLAIDVRQIDHCGGRVRFPVLTGQFEWVNWVPLWRSSPDTCFKAFSLPADGVAGDVKAMPDRFATAGLRRLEGLARRSGVLPVEDLPVLVVDEFETLSHQPDPGNDGAHNAWERRRTNHVHE